MSDAREALIRLAYDSSILENQISSGDGPVLRILGRAREAAADALLALIEVDLIGNIEAARTMQAEARRYRDLIHWTAQLAAEGKEAELSLNEADVDEIRDLVNPNPPTGDE